MDEKILNSLYQLGLKLHDGYKCIEKDKKKGYYNGTNIDNMLSFLREAVRIIDIIIHIKRTTSAYERKIILIALNIIERYQDESIPFDDRINLISCNSINANKKNNKQIVHYSIFYPANYYEYENILNEANQQIETLIALKELYISNIKSFNRSLKKIGLKKLKVNFNFGCSDEIIDFINKSYNCDNIKKYYLCYLHEISNSYIYLIYEGMNLKNDNLLLYFDNQEEYVKEIEKIVDKLLQNIKENELNELKTKTIDYFTENFSLMDFMGINYTLEIKKCESIDTLRNLTEKYLKFVEVTKIILNWSNFLSINIKYVTDDIKKIVLNNNIEYMIINYTILIKKYLIEYISTNLKTEFNIEINDSVISNTVNSINTDYNKVDDYNISDSIKIIKKECLKEAIKEKIKNIPKKLFKSLYSILSEFDENFNIFYEQLCNQELSINDFIDIIISDDENFTNLKQELNDEIELIGIYWADDKVNTLVEFSTFINNMLKKYNDNEARIWILNYLKSNITNNTELINIIDNIPVNDNNETSTKQNNNTIEDSDSCNISYVIFDSEIFETIQKNKFHSNEEKDKYLNIIRDSINYLTSSDYKNGNYKFTLKKYQKTNSCWKLKKTNNEMLTRIAIGFEKDNIIIGSIFKRPETNKLYNTYISNAENKINSITKQLQDDDIISKMIFIYDNILILKNIYDYFHTNMSSLTNDDINYDYRLLLQIILKFKNELKNVNYNILSLLSINELDKMNQSISNIEEELKNKILIKN